jgi:hypothetical protein
VGWTFPGEETAGIETAFVDRGGKTYLRVESVAEDGSPRDFYVTSAQLVGPDFTGVNVPLPQVAPGVYEAALGELPSGAYAVRITQTRSGTSPLGRTTGLVAPTAAEYRLLGANEPLLAAIRNATGGEEVDLALDVWLHDLATTSQYTELWPLLLVLALLLWPLDIALRRVSLGRRELADGRRWISDTVRGRRVAARPAVVADLMTARERAGSSAARSAILRAEAGTADATPPVVRPSSTGPVGSSPAAPSAPRAAPAAPSTPPAAPAMPSAPPASSAAAAPPAAPPPAAPASVDATQSDTLSRLREAKRRARG